VRRIELPGDEDLPYDTSLPLEGLLPAAVLFDMDGLLIDSEPIWTVAEHEIAGELGGEFTPLIKASMIGQALSTAVPLLLTGLDTPAARAADPAEVGRRLLTRMAELFADELPLQPGARDLLELTRFHGIPMALVSSSYRLLVDAALNVLGKDTFDATVAGDEVTATKPAPDPYLIAAEQLGVDPHLCLVLEDSMAGVESALAAGCRCILVPTFSPDVIPEGVDVHPTLERVDLIGLIHAMGRFRSSEDAS
jgi:HAD superfamily hydrolase (TIGR01509 family)